MRSENFTFDLGHQWRDHATGVALILDSFYFPEKDVITVHVFLNQKNVNSSTPAEGNPNFAFRFIISPAPRYPENAALGLLPWTPPGSPDKDAPLSFEQDITRHLNRLGIEGGKLDVTLVPYDPLNLLQGATLDLRGGVFLKFIDA